jgi:anti-sigma regulatory factor (Ser/Thr protein kinase)
LLSELITNAVQHGREPIAFSAACIDGTLRVEVFDANPSLAVRAPAIFGSDRGRGLNIVDALATRWGSEGAPEGKITWFEVTTKPGGWTDR